MALDKATIIDYAQRFRDALLSRSSLRPAAYGAAILGAVGAGSTAISVSTASLSPAQAQTMMVTPTMIPSAPASPTMLSTPIPRALQRAL